MNLVDALILLILLLALLGGIQRGFIHGLLDLLSWLGSLVLSLMCYPYVASWMDYDAFESSLWTAPLVFLVTFLFMRLFVGIVIGWFAGAIPTSAHTNMINKTLGLAPGLVNGFIYAALFATFVLVVPISDRISTEARESRLASPFSKPIAVLEEKLSPVFVSVSRETFVGKFPVTVTITRTDGNESISQTVTFLGPE